MGNFTVRKMSTLSEMINDYTYTYYYDELMLIARSVFKWNNLPNGINEEWIERFLYEEGKCVFFKDKTKGLMVAKCGDNGKSNVYDEPTIIRPIATNYIGPTLENNVNCILIKNNDISKPTYPTIQMYSWRLAEISRTIDINIQAMKTPILIKCSDKQKLSLKQVYKQWDGYEPLIFGDKALELDKFDVLKADAPIVFDKLQIQKHAIWNEAMTTLGINNANMDKRERLVDDEVQANNEQIEMSAQVMLRARERACELINEMFKTNISVELRKPEIEFMEESEGNQNHPKGSEGSGQVERGA